MSTSILLTKKIFVPEPFAELLTMVPNEHTDLHVLKSWQHKVKMDMSKLSYLCFDIATFYGSEMSEFIRYQTDNDLGQAQWEFDRAVAENLIDAIDDAFAEGTKDLDFEDDLKNLKCVILDELKAGTDSFSVDIWY